MLLERDTWINRMARTFLLIPVLMSALAVGYLFQALLPPAWLGDTTWTIVVVALIHAWKWMGLAMLIYLAGLKTIPEDITEAARIDGASRWRTFWAVRAPLLAPAVTFNVATVLLGSMNGFDIVQATTGGGPARTTDADVPAAFLGSLLVVAPTVLGVLVLGSVAAWELARCITRLTALLYAVGISGIILPPAVVTVVPLLRQLGLAGTAIGMICVYLGIYLSTVIFFVTGFVRTIPAALDEAAQIDGAGPVLVFRRIVLSLLRPVLATATILICGWPAPGST
ncbi:MAG: ABC transporter permease subunit [Actinoplanes sp.]